MNDGERREWVQNDEGLYALWRESRKSLRLFIKENRPIIDKVIQNVTSGKKRAHYLRYGFSHVEEQEVLNGVQVYL